MMNIISTAFFAGFTCCGIATIRGADKKVLPLIYVLSFISTAVYNIFNAKGMVSLGAFLGMCVIVTVIRYFHNLGEHSYLFIIVPAAYGFAPGAVLYKAFLGLFNLDFNLTFTSLIMTGKMLIGTVGGYYILTFIGDKITGKKVKN